MQRYWLKFEEAGLKYLLAAIVMALPLYPKFPVFNIPGTYVAVRAEDFLIAALSFFVIVRFFRYYKFFVKDKLFKAFLLFFSVGLASVFFGVFLTQTVVLHIGILHWLRRIEYIIPFFAAYLYIDKPAKVDFFVQTVLLTTFLVFLYGLGQVYLGLPVITTQNEEFSKGIALKWVEGARLNSTFAGHYDLAAFVVFVFPLAFSYFFVLKKKIDKLAVLVVLASMFWLLLMSSSRISLLSYLVSVTFTLLVLRKYLALAVILIVSIVLIGKSTDIASRFQYTLSTAGKKIEPGIEKLLPSLNFINKGLNQSQNNVNRWLLFNLEVLAESKPPSKNLSVSPSLFITPTKALPTPTPTPVLEDRSTAIRLNVEWPRALRAFFKNPILGTGYSSITLATDNDYLRLIGETGILGFLSFFLIFARAWERIKNLLFSKKLICHFIVPVVGGTIGMFLIAFFIDIFEASKIAPLIWMFLGFSIKIADGQRI